MRSICALRSSQLPRAEMAGEGCCRMMATVALRGDVDSSQLHTVAIAVAEGPGQVGAQNVSKL